MFLDSPSASWIPARQSRVGCSGAVAVLCCFWARGKLCLGRQTLSDSTDLSFTGTAAGARDTYPYAPMIFNAPVAESPYRQIVYNFQTIRLGLPGPGVGRPDRVKAITHVQSTPFGKIDLP